MAAGRGSRMMPLTNDIPKAMARFGDTTLIANSIEKLKKNSLNIHITVGYKGSDLAKHVIEHDVATLMKNLDEPVLVLTCDNITELDLDLIHNDYISLNKPPCIVVPVKPVKGLEGDYIFHKNNRVLELNRHKVSDIYCSGIQLLNPAIINRLCRPTEDFYSLWVQLIEQNLLFCSNVYPKKWITVDTIEQLEAANKIEQ
jgi:NDP-sugar pyrophosphorylase family protein